MSSATGGQADKLGNRYEGLWVAYKLVQLLAEEIRTVQLEALGDDEHGVDLWVTGKDSNRDAQQCKRKNRAVGKWTLAELIRQGVVTALAEQLRRNPSARFTFISAHPAAELRELCDAARSASDDPAAYFAATFAVNAHAGNLRKFCGGVGVSSQDSEGKRQAFDLLCRTYTHSFEDSPEGRAIVCSLARCHITGNPETAVEVLANFAQDHMRTPITTEMVRQHLRDRGFGLTNIAGMPSVFGRIERLRVEFQESLRPSLINSALVSRPETQQIIDLINQQDDNRLIVLHGRAGGGKSCVLLQLIEGLEEMGIPYLPLRLDRRPPQVSAQRYGMDVCDLPESPAVVLHSLYRGRRAVLVVDQLDAIRWTTSHASAHWEACQEMIDQALGFPNLIVVVACRSFDLRDDQQISNWQSRRKGHEVEVGELPLQAVADVVRGAGGSYDALTERQRTLLRSPLHLALWTQVHQGGEPQPVWSTHADLMRAFWNSRYEALSALGVPADESRDAIDALTADLDSRGELAAPARILDRYRQAATALRSLHVIVESGSRVTFAHQSYFEYHLAVRLLDRVATGEQTVPAWVQCGDQSLLRREQLRLVLTLLRDERHDEYVRTLRQIITAPRGSVRFHLRQLLLRLLGEAPTPSGTERALVRELVQTDEWRDHMLDQVFTRQPVWFEDMDDRGLLAAWLASTDERLVTAAVNLCHWWSSRCGDRVARLLSPHADQPDPWPQRAAAVLPFDPVEDSSQLFAMRVSLIRAGVCRNRFLHAEKLAVSQPGRCVDLLEAYFDFRLRGAEQSESAPCDEREMPYSIPMHEVEHVQKVASAIPEQFWSRLVPQVVRACESTLSNSERRDDCPFIDDRTWPEQGRRVRYDGNVELPKLVAGAGAAVVTRDPDLFRRDFGHILDHRARTIQYMVGLMLAEVGDPAADLAIEWLCDVPPRLSLRDEQGHEWGIAQQIIRRHARACSADAYRRLEATLLSYHEPDERRSVEWKLQCARGGWPIKPNMYGLAQHALLPCLPAERLSRTARSEIGVLERKFRQSARAYYRARMGGMLSLVPPIPADRVARIGDAGWLEIIRNAARPAGAWNHREIGGRFFTEPTAEAYARMMGEQARMQPWRFARLALRIPANADPEYFSAILYHVGDGSPPTQDLTDWTPATDEEVTALIEHVGYRVEGDIGRAMCWLMEKRRQALSTPRCMETLRRYAVEHPHPRPDDLVVGTGNRERETDYDAAAINSTRGIALGVIKHILFDEPRSFGSFLPTIRQAVSDPSPIVRVAAAGVCLPILNIDRSTAVELFLTASATDERALATQQMVEFIRYAQCSHYGQLESLLARMAASSVPAVATMGATWITIGWLCDQAQRSVVDQFLRGSPAQRRGVAKAAAHNCADLKTAEKCAELLSALIADPDEEVQDVVGEFLREQNVLQIPALRATAVRFAGGPGFLRHPSWLIRALRTHPDSLVPLAPIISVVCDRLASDMIRVAQDPGGRNSFELHEFVPLLLRLYEQAEQARDRNLWTTCLDWWDRLLEARVGEALELLSKLDRGAAPVS